MNDQDHAAFDPRIADWLEGDPNDAPDQALQVVLAAFPSIKQRHALRLPWRTFDMTTAPTFAIGAATVVAVVLGGAFLLKPPDSGSGVGGATAWPTTALPSVTPPEADAPVDTSDWVAFSSERYGFDIAYPPLWTAHQSTKDWTLAASPDDHRDWLSRLDHFDEQPNQRLAPLTAGAITLAVPAGMSRDDLITAYHAASAVGARSECTRFALDLGQVMVDGHEATFTTSSLGCDAIQAFVFVDDRAYVFAVSGENEEALLKAFLSTVRFQPQTASGPADSAALPASGDLKPGTHTIERATWGGRPGIGGSVEITLPAGWTGDGGAAIMKSVVGTSQGMRLSLGTLAGISRDPCLWAKGTLDQKEHSHYKAEAEALAAQPGRTGPGPTAVAIAAWHGYRVELTTPVDTTSCEGSRFRSWTVPDRHDVYQWPGQIDLLWLVDTDREMFYIDASYFPATSAEDRAEIARIVESIRFIW